MPIPGSDSGLQQWLQSIADPEAPPAGGAAAAIAGALAAALAEMVSGLTGRRPRYASVHGEAARLAARAEVLREELVSLAVHDAEAFGEFIRALALPRTTDAERGIRERARGDALRAGADVQLDLLERVAEVADLSFSMADHGLASALGDAATGVFLSAAAARSAYWAARSNLAGLTDDGGRLAGGLAVLQRVEAAERGVLRLIEERVR